MDKIKVIVFPCGSEVGLEIHRSLQYSAHIDLWGASSIDDHGCFVYEQYINRMAYADNPEFIEDMRRVIREKKFDVIYPAMDRVAWLLKNHEDELGCRVIAPDANTTSICLSKSKTYRELKDLVQVPRWYESLDEVNTYPVFLKPDIGYGSRGTLCAGDEKEARDFLTKKQSSSNTTLILEYLPGPEYTVDCFTDRYSELLFAGARCRARVRNGISVNTYPVRDGQDVFYQLAKRISEHLRLRGAWFFQVKENSAGELVLLEVAARLGGSSALYRNKGINFALLSVYDSMGNDVKVSLNNYEIVLDRALSNRYRINLRYQSVYVDLDDCLIVRGKINTGLIAFLYRALNEKKKIILVTKHSNELSETLAKFRLQHLFDDVIHLKATEEKYTVIGDRNSIFIDDSFQERTKVQEATGISVFSPDMVECLM